MSVVPSRLFALPIGKILALPLVCMALELAAAPAFADVTDATGTLVMNDRFGTQKEWGNALVLPRDGRISRVMDGTYGFVIKDSSGKSVARFLDPQSAVGTALAAGTYNVEPFVCARHRHHHVEISVEY